jgi:signal transduction histidine kinase
MAGEEQNPSIQDREQTGSLAALAHEVRNDLAVIRNCAQLLRQHAGNLPAAARPLELLENQVEAAGRRIGQVLLRATPAPIEPSVPAIQPSILFDASQAGDGSSAPIDRRVLIVDDDRFLVETLAELLQNEGFATREAFTGEEALAILRFEPQGVALVDVRLPDVGGIELMGRMRAIQPNLDVVVITGNASVHSAIAALNQGASRYVLKPCAPDELKSVLNDLRERRLLRERSRLYRRRLLQAEKHSAVGRLAAGLAHEVGTPLNIISGRAEWILEKVGSEDPQAARGLKTIIQQIERISHLVKQLLDFARETSPVRERVSLGRVIAVVVELLDRALVRAEIDCVVSIAPDLPDVHADFNQMQQVFLNLLMNSVDAIVADPEHGRIKARGRIEIEAEAVADGSQARIRVIDNGHGIVPEDLDRVFDPFFTTKPVGTGTGLGLAVVYGIIMDHSGSISASSTPGTGTSMTFFLPTII